MLFTLEEVVQQYIKLDFPLHSRIHKLKSYSSSHLHCYIKRDDELGLMGSKTRKFSSLMTFLIHQKAKTAIVIGGINSNHVLGISQLLIENQIQPFLFLCKSHQQRLKGNALLTQLLVPKHQIHWIERQDWPTVYKAALDFADLQGNQSTYIIPEGGCMPESFPGALTLPIDILYNESQEQIHFNHIFVDSGTGLTAIALIVGLAFLQHSAHVHVVLMAGKEDEFLDNLKCYHQHFEKLVKLPCRMPTHFSLCRPHQAKSFGATSAKTFKDIHEIAQTEGVLCDPIYNVKLFKEAQRIIQQKNLKGKALVIQSGGTLSLLGFL